MLNSCFLFMQGPELMNKYVGESERAVREVRFCLKVELCIGEPHFCPLVSILYGVTDLEFPNLNSSGIFFFFRRILFLNVILIIYNT